MGEEGRREGGRRGRWRFRILSGLGTSRAVREHTAALIASHAPHAKPMGRPY
jgi:hypothetical protein